MNRPEMIVFNGIVQYVGYLPWVGRPIKRAAILAADRRFRYVRAAEHRRRAGARSGTARYAVASRVAHVAAERFADPLGCAETSAALRALYCRHAGAAGRMADALLEDVAR